MILELRLHRWEDAAWRRRITRMILTVSARDEVYAADLEARGGNWRNRGVIGYKIGRKRDKIRNKFFKKKRKKIVISRGPPRMRCPGLFTPPQFHCPPLTPPLLARFPNLLYPWGMNTVFKVFCSQPLGSQPRTWESFHWINGKAKGK